MNDILIESLRSVIVFVIIVILHWRRREYAIREKSGFSYIILGFYFILGGCLLDASDNFPQLNQFIILGDTPTEAFLEKVMGYTGGFLFLAFGLLRWLPVIRESEKTKLHLETSRKELADSEKHFRELATMLPEIVYETDTAGKLSFANDRAFELTGYTKEDFEKGIFVLSLIVEEERGRAAENIRRILSGGSVGITEYNMRRKDGTIFPTMIFSALYSRQGNIAGLRGIIIDMTRIKQMEAHLLQSQKMEAIGTLTGGIAHDFNNMLQGISGFADLALSSGDLSEKDRNRLKHIEEICANAACLVRGLMSFSRKEEPSFTYLDLNAEIRRSLELLERILPKSVVIETDLAQGELPIMGDSNQLMQILINLASNASDAMGGNGVIRLSTAMRGFAESPPFLALKPSDYVEISFSDNGTGIDSSQLPRIFEPFYTTKKIGKGTGLGLSIVFGLVKAHGGEIYCESVKDKGADFRIFLPKAPQEWKGPGRGDEEKGRETLPLPLSLLLVDDNREVAKSISEALCHLGGCNVTTAHSGEEALRLYNEKMNALDIVILDVGMPGMDGIQCMREIRRMNPQCKVIFSTGYAMASLPRDEAGRSAEGIITKPYRLDKLLREIRKITQ